MEQSSKAICNKLPKFYKELLDLWQSLSAGEINELEFVLTQNLWTMLSSYLEAIHYLTEVQFLKALIIFQILLIVMVTLPAGILR